MLVLGISIAFSVIASSTLRDYNKIAVSDSEKKERSEKDDEKQTVISEFQAITPAAQSDFQPTKTLFEHIAVEFLIIEEKATSYVQRTSQKLFYILFRLIISPNAP